MTKKRTINEIRQTKDAVYTHPRSKPKHNWNGEKITLVDVEDQEAAKQMAEIDYQEWADKANSSEEMKQNRCPLDLVEEAKILIVDKITNHFNDVMFEMVNEEMMDYRVFQSQNYLTEEGYELFEDEYFEFYHEHHGDILYQVMKNLFNQPNITN